MGSIIAITIVLAAISYAWFTADENKSSKIDEVKERHTRTLQRELKKIDELINLYADHRSLLEKTLIEKFDRSIINSINSRIISLEAEYEQIEVVLKKYHRQSMFNKK